FGFDLADQDHGVLGDHPSSARIPRRATKPSGLPDNSSAATTPIKPSGATLNTRNKRSKIRSATSRTVSMTGSLTGTTEITETGDFWFSSTVPPTATR